LNEPDRATGQADGTHSFTIETFTSDLGAVVDLAYHKGNLYALNASTARIEMIHYVGGDNRIPSARLSAAPALGSPPLTVTFSAEKSTDVDDVVLHYHWDWGDDSEPLVTSTPVVSHTYAADGTYTARLKVV